MQKGQAREQVIRTQGLTKSYDTLVAVHELNLEVLRGDVFGFLGPNGSGKTTTIRMLLGLSYAAWLDPTYGWPCLSVWHGQCRASCGDFAACWRDR